MRGKNTKRDERQRTLATAIILGALGAVAAEPALAQGLQQVSSDERVQFDIAAQPLSSALSEFARQARVNALYFSDDLRGLSSPPLRGSFTRQQALDLLLQRSGYNGRISGGNLVLVQEPSARPQQDSAANSGAQGVQPRSSNIDDDEDAEEEIVVTGTRIRGAAPAGANLITMDRAAIEESGRATIQDVLQTLPQVFPGSQSEISQLNSTAGGRNIAFGSTVDLRGLGADATLTLVNGHRLAPAGFGNFVDVSAIPVAAVERVEVLADGASATYGSDAVGGVVNIILRSNFDGAETQARLGSVTEGDMTEAGFSQVFGGVSDRGSLVAGYAYRTRDALAAADRDFAADTDLRGFGGTNFSRNQSNPGNIIRVGSTTTNFAIPEGQDGTSLNQAQLIAGQTNWQNGNEDANLLPAQESHSLFASARYELTERLEIFADVFGTDRYAESVDAQLGANLAVPQSNAYRQLNGLFPGAGNITIAYFLGDDLGPIRYATDSRSISTVAGLNLDLFANWRLEATAGFSTHADHVRFSNAFDSASLAPALASSNLATAFNPFGDGSHTDAAVLQNLTLSQNTQSDSDLISYAVKLDGPLFDLPGGAARLAIGAEQRDESFSIERFERRASGIVSPAVLFAPGERTVSAYFAELYAPLIDADEDIPLVHALSLSLSVRREESSDFGEATTPKIGVRWALDENLVFRATWGTSFKAPQFQQLLGSIGGTIASFPPTLDPLATNGSTGVLQIAGSNRDLEPEEAEAWTAGFDFTPAFLQGFRLQATYFNVDFSNRIAAPGNILEAIANPQNYVGFFIRNPTPEQVAAYLAIPDRLAGAVPPDGIELIWDERLTNLASLQVRGIDVSASYAFDTDIGDFTLAMSASHLLEFSRRASPSLPAFNSLDTMLNQIDWRGRASIGWSGEHWRASLAANYADDYRDTISTPNRRIDSWTTYDLNLSRVWGEREDGEDSLFETTLYIRNLTDEDPPFANNPVGMAFDTLNASPIGRLVSIELRRRW